MIVDVQQPILDHNNKPIMREGRLFTLKDAAQECLLMMKEQDTLPAEKLKRYTLAMKLNESKVDLSMEDIVKLKEIVGQMQGPLVYGRVVELLDEKRLTLIVPSAG